VYHRDSRDNKFIPISRLLQACRSANQNHMSSRQQLLGSISKCLVQWNRPTWPTQPAIPPGSI